MATPLLVTDPDDPRLSPYRAIRERDLVGRQGRFIIEGEVALRLMLARGRFGLESVLLSERRLKGSPELAASVPGHAPLFVAPDPLIESVAGFAVHRGVLGVGLTGEPASVGSLLDSLPERALVAVAVGLANHDNMGGLFRNAAAFGAAAVLLDPTSCDPLYRKAIRVSVGAALTMPFARGASAQGMLEALQARNFECFALSPSGAIDLDDVEPPARAALVLGAEGPGLPAEWMRGPKSLRIPMAADFDSLNVATASGIALQRFFGRQNKYFQQNP